jgi:CheY-like chemotaxis protein
MPDDHRLGSVARRLAATQRVLVIEDEHDIADFLRAYFRASGYDLVHIDPDTPLAVLEALDANEPDCVLLDLNLRGFSGAEAYRLLRTEPRYAFTPVIVVSARPDIQELVSSRSELDAFVTKPFNVNTLAGLVVDRIAAAGRLRASAVADDGTELLGHDYVEARLVDEIGATRPGQPVAFALVRLLTLADIVAEVGDDGLAYVTRELVRKARGLLPEDAALGLTRSDELAVLLPATTAADAAKLLTFAIDSLGALHLPGGAEVVLQFAVGVAAYPEHASDADGLYMAADVALAGAVDSNEPLTIAI